MTRTCVALCSGGLDSLLTVALMSRMPDIRVVAFHATSVFHDADMDPNHEATLRAKLIGLGAEDVVFRDASQTMIDLIRNPRHGFGRFLNPCIDCRIATIAMGKAVMDEVGADFVATGEVIGQRPMSQRRDALRLAEKRLAEIGLAGLLVRPLSAKLLSPTIPEEAGWIDRERMFDFQGRNRKPQMALAAEIGLTDYPAPAGGCLLTDEGFSLRLQDLIDAGPDWGPEDVRLLRVGRHFRFGSARIVVSRRQEEGDRLKELARPTDRFYITVDRPGAMVLVRGDETTEIESAAAGLAVFFSRFRDAATACVRTWRQDPSDVARVLQDVGLVDPASLAGHQVGLRTN